MPSTSLGAGAKPDARAEALNAIEGQENFEALRRFLITVETLNKERRLLRKYLLGSKTGHQLTALRIDSL
jgi:hypothetical protein